MVESKGPWPKIAIGMAGVAVVVSVIAVVVIKSRKSEPEPTRTALAQAGDAAVAEPSPITGDAALAPDQPTPPDPVSTPTDPVPPDDDPSATCAERCEDPDDCKSIPCACEDGTVVNTRRCHNDCCVLKDEACSASCERHDGPRGTWDAVREGGKQTGKGCKADGDCASKICIRGYCSRKCTSFGDCPPFWECVDPTSGFDKICRRK